MNRKRNFYRIMKRMTKNFWKSWKMASASRYHQVSNVKRGMRGARRLFLAMLYGLAALQMVVVVAALATVLTGCASQKDIHEHHTHNVSADTIATEASHDRQSHTERQNIDSIVTASVWTAMQEFMRQEQEHEVTTETLTETIDSLGRVIRQQQRTTDRTLSRQEQQRQEQTAQQLKSEIHSALERLDSVWSERFAQLKTHYEQRDSSTTDMHKATGSAAAKKEPWFLRLWNYIRTTATVVLALIVLIFISKKKS